MLTLHTNLKNNATTQLAGFDFNSFCKFGEHYLACSTTKLCEIGGETYDGVDIASVLETFVTKLGYAGNKRLQYIYLGVETEGTVIVTPTVDGADQPAVTFAPTAPGRQYIYKPVGRGSTGAYWSFKVENVDGCWFAIDHMSASVVKLRR